MDSTVSKQGVSRLMIPESAIPMIINGELWLRRSFPLGCLHVERIIELPCMPKWMRGIDGEIQPITGVKNTCIMTHEMAMYPVVLLGRLGNLQKRIGATTLGEVRKYLAAIGEKHLKKEETKKHNEMLLSCRWVCSLYRVPLTVLPADEPGKSVAVVVFHELGMIGG